MSSSDTSKTIFIIFIFIGLVFYNILRVSIKQIEEEWPVNRCNPMYMPFASFFGHNTSENFSFCIQNMQSSYMGVLLQPLNYNFSVMTDFGTSLTKNLTDVRAFFSNIRTYTTDIVQSIFGVFLNILVEFQRTIVNIKDLFGKLTGIMTTMMYTLQGSMMTMESTWAGPPGQLTRALCFHPETLIKLQNGEEIKMKDIKLNSVLKNGAQVRAKMQISNLDKNGDNIEFLYSIKGGENNLPILVSGSHLIYCPNKERFIHVKDLPEANIILTEKCEVFECLITSNHTIPIGEWIFHDWEDNNGSEAKKI
jgi:hypothetical protein